MGWRKTANSGADGTPEAEPKFFVQLLGIPLIAYALASIQTRMSLDCLPLWISDPADSQPTEAFNYVGRLLHKFLFLGAVLVVYAWDFIMDLLAWAKLGFRLNTAFLWVAIGLLIAGFGVVISPWIMRAILSEDVVSGPFGLQSLSAWFCTDWGVVLLFLVGVYGYFSVRKIPFLAMVSPLIISLSITLLLFMPEADGFWWFGDSTWVNGEYGSGERADWYKEVQILRTDGLMFYIVGFFMLNVLLIQNLEKSKDWASNAPNVWLLFAVNFSEKKLKYREEEPDLSSFPKFWWVPYFWLLVAAILIVVGLSFVVKGDDILVERTANFMEPEHLKLYFQRYAFRGMLLGVFYAVLLSFRSAIQWNRIYRLLVEVGLLILVV